MMRVRLLSVLIVLSPFACAQQPEPAPAFPGQTDAPAPETPSDGFRLETITAELNGPWALAFLPDGGFLVTERLGTLRTVSPAGEVSPPIEGVPAVKVVAAQGFHDLALDPDFASNRLVYFTYFAP